MMEKYYNGLFGNWLSDRKHTVMLNGQLSDWRDVLNGVPQGSVFGLLHTNETQTDFVFRIYIYTR